MRRSDASNMGLVERKHTDSDESKSPSPVLRNTDWMLVDAVKEKSRTEHSDQKQSLWRMTFVRYAEGAVEVKRIQRLAEHKQHLRSAPTLEGRRKLRGLVYPSGVTAVFKELQRLPGAEDDFPNIKLGLKSYNSHLMKVEPGEARRRGDDALGMTPKQVKDYRRLSFALGAQAVVVERTNRNGHKRYGIVQSSLGLGVDLQIAASWGLLAATSPDKWLDSTVKLLARLQFYQEVFKRPILDLKTENIVPEFDESGQVCDLHFIDLDDAVKHCLVYTPQAMDEASKAHLKAAGFWCRDGVEELLSHLSVAIDYRSLNHELSDVFRTQKGLPTTSLKNLLLQLGEVELDGEPVNARQLLQRAMIHPSEKRRLIALFDATKDRCMQRWQQANILMQAPTDAPSSKRLKACVRRSELLGVEESKSTRVPEAKFSEERNQLKAYKRKREDNGSETFTLPRLSTLRSMLWKAAHLSITRDDFSAFSQREKLNAACVLCAALGENLEGFEGARAWAKANYDRFTSAYTHGALGDIYHAFPPEAKEHIQQYLEANGYDNRSPQTVAVSAL